MPPSNDMLELLLEQMDLKHTAAHQRLRHDLTEGFALMGREQEQLEHAQRVTEVAIVKQQATRERRRELSASRAVMLAAAIGGLFHLLSVLITAFGK